jgi:hypothetical protein
MCGTTLVLSAYCRFIRRSIIGFTASAQQRRLDALHIEVMVNVMQAMDTSW